MIQNEKTKKKEPFHDIKMIIIIINSVPLKTKTGYENMLYQFSACAGNDLVFF